MAKTKGNTDTPAFAAGLQVEQFGRTTTYTGTRDEILSAGIMPADLLPEQFQDFEVIHNGHSIRGSKYGYGKWLRWEVDVFDLRIHITSIDDYRERFTMGLGMTPDYLQRISQVDSADGFTYCINAQDAEEIHKHLAHAQQAVMTARLTRSRTDAPALRLIQGGKSESTQT